MSAVSVATCYRSIALLICTRIAPADRSCLQSKVLGKSNWSTVSNRRRTVPFCVERCGRLRAAVRLASCESLSYSSHSVGADTVHRLSFTV